MKLNFDRKNMDIGTPTFLFMRAVMSTPSGGADLSECLAAAERIKDGDDASWVREWRSLAEGLEEKGGAWLAEGQTVSGRNAIMRASTYFRNALWRCSAFDPAADELLTRSRECFENAGALYDPPVEVVRVPYQGRFLPAYFISAGKPGAPTLIGANGGDSTNEEMFHIFGFAARERGWNCLVFEGPGQYTARQMNPDLHLRSDWEVPTGAMIDWLLARPEVDPKRIALFGWSLSANLAIRAAAMDKRIAAVISNGLIVDVFEAWFGIWPKWLQRAKPRTFDRYFHLFEKSSAQVRALTGIFYKLHGVDSPSAVIQAWKPFNVTDMADKLTCPTLFMLGEAELAEQTAGPFIYTVARFLEKVKAPAWLAAFGYEAGYAASHCQIGAQTRLQDLVYDWLDMVLVHPERMSAKPARLHDLAMLKKRFGKAPGIGELADRIRISEF